MKVKLLHTNGLEFIDSALGECYDKGCYTDVYARDKRIKNIALKKKHESVLEFGNFIFQIEANTKVLLEMTRHRVANYACKSSRYTLNKGEIVFEPTGDETIDFLLDGWKKKIENQVELGKSNELTSLMLPQAYQYRWQVQFNARALRQFFKLRLDKSAHFSIREVAEEMFKQIPDDYKYLFEEFLYKNND